MIIQGDKKKVLSAILGSDGDAVAHTHDEDGADELHVICEEVIDAVHNKDAKALAEAIRAVFEHLDSEPHVEGPHLKDE